MFETILNKIKEFDTIIIHRHIRPDGDCIGCQFGLKYFIQDNFPLKKVYAVGDEIPDYLKHIGTNDIIDDDIYQNALVIVVDTALTKRICDERYQKGAYVIKIDHHDDSEQFGDFAYVDEKSPACSLIITQILQESKLPISSLSANALYTGIITDTGRFRFRGVVGDTLKRAGDLLDNGVDMENIFSHLYIKSDKELKLQGYVYNHFKTTKNGVAYIYFTKDIMKKYGVTKDEAASLINCLDSIRGSLIWVALIDQVDENSDTVQEIRVRLRSRYVAINEVGTHYHGGGHLQAAGATVYSLKEMKQMLKELDILLKNYKEEHPEVF